MFLEQFETGAAKKLSQFLAEAKYKYEVGIHQLVFKPGRSLKEFADIKLLKDVMRLDVFKSMSSHIRKYFHHPDIIRLLEFPVLFLGAMPEDTPALYSLMNYADIELGTWYPMGGMYKIIEAMVQVAQKQGVKFRYHNEAARILTKNNQAIGVETNQGVFYADVVVSSADYHFTETKLLPTEFRNYSDAYWKSRVMAPSSLLYYVGIKGKIDGIKHHTLFFDKDFAPHAKEIYKQPSWPSEPLFYACCPSVTDASVAPEGHENLFLLIPVASELEGTDTDEIRETYFNKIIKRLENQLGTSISDRIVFKHAYSHRNFIEDYGALRGNAYGLANTLKQTAILKPSLKNKKLSNLYYTGQLTVPGPGVPPSLISGEVVANEIAIEHPLEKPLYV
jgi:phytoene desaturase